MITFKLFARHVALPIILAMIVASVAGFFFGAAVGFVVGATLGFLAGSLGAYRFIEEYYDTWK